MRISYIFICFILLSSPYLFGRSTFVHIPGCPSLYLFQSTITNSTINPNENITLPPCFCDNATEDSNDPPIQINCLINPIIDDLTKALENVKKAGKKVSVIHLEGMTFDADNISIPDNYFRDFGFTPTEITITGCIGDKFTLHDTFKGLEKSLKKLHIAQCILLSMPPSIPKLTALESLTLEDTYIYTFEKEDFRGLKNLKYLNLVGNRMYYIEEGAFDDFHQLETAILGPRNSLNASMWEEFDKITSLKTLVLENNQLYEMPDNALSSLRRLQTLDLTSNFIVNITMGAFEGLTNLTKLVLSQNSIQRIDDGSFRDLINLKSLELQANYIEDIWPETFTGLGSLEYLNVDANNFYFVDKATFAAMPKLKTLNFIGEDKLQFLDPKAFEGLRYLEILNLSYSNITTIRTDWLKSVGLQLQALDARSSNVSYLNPDSFRYGANIKNLSLAQTPLRSVPNGVFSYLTNIRYLDLSNVKWTCDDQLTWLIRWLREKNESGMTLVDSHLTTCWVPLELRNHTLISLDPDSLRPYDAPSEIEQPSTTTTTTTTVTTQSLNGTNVTETQSTTTVSTTVSATVQTTTLDAAASKSASTSEDSKKVRIVIAIVASVASVATILVILTVVLIMRKRRRKQNERGAVSPTSTAQSGRSKPPEETEMTIRDTNGVAKNGQPPVRVVGSVKPITQAQLHQENEEQSTKPPPSAPPDSPTQRRKSEDT